MRKNKWKSAISLLMAAALTVSGIGVANPLTADAAADGAKAPSAKAGKAVSGDVGVSADNGTFYIDAVGGNDANDGKSQEKAWKSFKNVSDLNLVSDAKVLLKAGCTWNGEKLMIKNAKGTEGHPVTLGKYGEGKNPVINGQGSKWLDNQNRGSLNKEDVAAVHIQNSEYITIENLEVTNLEEDAADLQGKAGQTNNNSNSPDVKIANDQSKYMLTGILVENHDAGELKGVTIKNNYVHNVNGYMSKNEVEGGKKGSGGIMALVTGGTTKSFFTDLVIEGNEVDNVCHEAIYMESCWAARTLVGGTKSQQAGDKEWVGWPNVNVRNNYVHDVAGDGIVMINADGGTAEHNLLVRCAREDWDYSNNPAHAAIWAWDCNNVTFQNNEAAYTQSTQDGMAFDSDYGNQNILYQYNYSHNNKGGFWMACPGPYYTVNSVVRYNVSVNDGLFDGSRIIRAGETGSIGNQVYNNTIYWDHNYTVGIVEQGSWGKAPSGGTDIYNNIFYGKKGTFVNNEGIHYDNNCVWGGIEEGYPLEEDFHVLIADPKLSDVKNCTDGSFANNAVTLGSVTGMQLLQDSPCIDAGIAHMAVPDSTNIPESWFALSTKNAKNEDIKEELKNTQMTAADKDYSGNTVPYGQNGKVDIGAFEYQGTGTYQPQPVETDKAYLQALYNQAMGYKDKDDKGELIFTEVTWNAMASVRDSAKQVLDNVSVIQATVDAVAEKLQTAMRGLTKPGAVQEGTVSDSCLSKEKYGKENEDNAGFESDECSWGQWSNKEEAKRELSTEKFHSGAKSLKLTKGTDGTAFSEIGGIPVTPNTEYILTAWCYTEGDITSVGLEAKHHNSYTSDGNDHKIMNKTFSSDAEKDDNNWYKFSAEFTTEDYDKLSIALSSDVDVAYIDDVVLYPKTIETGEKLEWGPLEQALKLTPGRSESYYTPGSWRTFQEKKLAARLKYADALADQAQIDTAKDELTDAYVALAKRANHRVLELTYNSCKNKQKGSASQKAWDAFQEALKSAEAMVANEDATQAEVDEALMNLKNARDGLTAVKPAQVITVGSKFTKAIGAKSFKLNAKVKTGDGKLSYKSSAKGIADVDKNGKVTLKGIGTCTITVTAAGTDNYSAKSVKVTVTVNPNKAVISSAKPVKGRKLTVKWKKDGKAAGYEVQCSLKKDFKKIAAKTTVKNASKTTVNFTKLAKGKKYFVRVRAYKKVGKQTFYGEWSNPKQSAKIKK